MSLSIFLLVENEKLSLMQKKCTHFTFYIFVKYEELKPEYTLAID